MPTRDKSMWNGNYGEQEKARRETYPRAEKYQLQQMIGAGQKKPPPTQRGFEIPDWSKVIKDR
jgi:hypothetical protein